MTSSRRADPICKKCYWLAPWELLVGDMLATGDLPCPVSSDDQACPPWWLLLHECKGHGFSECEVYGGPALYGLTSTISLWSSMIIYSMYVRRWKTSVFWWPGSGPSWWLHLWGRRPTVKGGCSATITVCRPIHEKINKSSWDLAADLFFQLDVRLLEAGDTG